jgi:tetratricopeptide (TPR) repeat protein
MRDYEAVAGEWAVAVWDMVGDGPPPGAEDAYVICGFAAAMVTAMGGEEGPRPEELNEAIQLAVSYLSDTVVHPVLALPRPLAALFTGDVEGAHRHLLVAAEHPDPWARAAAHTFSGQLWMSQGNLEQAAAETAEGYAAFHEIGDRWGMVVSLSGLAEVALAYGDAARAILLCQEAYGYATEGISPDQGGMLLIQLGRARAVAGDLEGARADLERGVQMVERIGEHADAAYGYVGLSELARRAGELGKARSLLEHSLAIIEPRAHRPDLGGAAALTFGKLGCLAEQEGDLVVAAQWHVKAIRRVAESTPLPVTPLLATVVEGLAALAAARGEQVRAAELLGTAHTLHGFRDGWSFEVRRTTEAATTAIGAEAFDAAYQRGREVSTGKALELTP